MIETPRRRSTTTGTYTIEIVSDQNGNNGQYTIQATLNAFVKQGTSNDTIGTAQDLTGTSFGLGHGGADRLAGTRGRSALAASASAMLYVVETDRVTSS